jgi:hypothetical protein
VLSKSSEGAQEAPELFVEAGIRWIHPLLYLVFFLRYENNTKANNERVALKSALV